MGGCWVRVQSAFEPAHGKPTKIVYFMRGALGCCAGVADGVLYFMCAECCQSVLDHIEIKFVKIDLQTARKNRVFGTLPPRSLDWRPPLEARCRRPRTERGTLLK